METDTPAGWQMHVLPRHEDFRREPVGVTHGSPFVLLVVANGTAYNAAIKRCRFSGTVEGELSLVCIDKI